MKIHPEELQASELYSAEKLTSFPRIDSQQLLRIRDVARSYLRWHRDHVLLHNLINALVLIGLLAADAWLLLKAPGTFATNPGSDAGPFLQGWRYLISLLVCSFLHGTILYNLTVFTMHEGAAHSLIFVGRHPWMRALNRFAFHACRLCGSDPEHYKEIHTRHHNRFSTEHDGSFLNFVLPSRFLRSLLPFAIFAPFNDFRVHIGERVTSSQLLSTVIALSYTGLYAMLIGSRYGLGFASWMLFVLGPWVAFMLDRLRESTEHNLMPRDAISGTRNLGYGIWGLWIGGGPWGQPCHLSHHLAPALPWYQQILLHRTILRELTSEQRAVFTHAPVVGFPKFVKRMLQEGRIYEQRVKSNKRWLRAGTGLSPC